MGATSTPRKPLAPGDRLPRVKLPRAGGGTVTLRDPARGAVVVAYLARPSDPDAREYVAALRAMESEFRQWYGRAVVVAGTDAGGTADVSTDERMGTPVVPDPGGEVRRTLGIQEGGTALFIADRWGQLYGAWRGVAADELPEMEEIVEWLRFLATQCPECGVPDEAGAGEWAR